MLVEIECITIAQNEATTEVVAVVENRDVTTFSWRRLLAGGALDLAQTSSLAAQTAQVKQLRTANLVRPNLLDLIDNLRVVGEDALDALAEAHLANGKGTLRAFAARNHHALKRLETLFLAFTNLDLYANGVAGGELR
jgi:hypothetical protein